MKKSIILWLAPLIVFIGIFLSSQLNSPHRANPQSALQHLVISMRHKDMVGVSEVCTNQGRRQLIGIEKDAEFNNYGLYDYVKSKGFQSKSSSHDDLEIWRVWSNYVDIKNLRMEKSFYAANAVSYSLEKETVSFHFVKTWSGWKLHGLVFALVR